MSCKSVNPDLLVKVMNVKPNSIIEVHLHLNFVCIWTSGYAQDIGGYRWIDVTVDQYEIILAPRGG